MAKVTINKNTELVTEGESIYTLLGAVCGMEKPGEVPMLPINVQSGTYLQEDKIILYKDTYNRA